MSRKKILIFLGVLALLILFSWAVINVCREVEIANFSTSISERTPEQIENIKIALAKIDGKILRPGEIFSFNEIVGERLKHLGFRGAPTIYQGTVIDTPGGGLCQLSSTIYNTALLSGMEIIERKPHLWVIRSVGPGRDAAIVYDRIDLKFKNNLPFSIRIKSEITETLLIIKFIASGELKYKVDLSVDILQVYRAPHHPRGTPDVPGKRAGRDGVKVKVIRTFREKDGTEKEEVISIDSYKPVPGEK